MKIFFLVLILIFSQFSFAGIDQGNGGNIIYCPKQKKNLSLDYVLASYNFGRDVVIFDTQDIDASMARISKLINEKLPELGPSFSEFVKYLYNEKNPTLPYYWKKSLSPLSNTNDQNIGQLPIYCMTTKSEPVEIHQAVIRTDNSAAVEKLNIVFEFDQDYLTLLDGQQMSFLYVHEWLWNISDNVVKNRNFNYLLHSTLFDTMTSEQFRDEMKKIAFRVNKDFKNLPKLAD